MKFLIKNSPLKEIKRLPVIENSFNSSLIRIKRIRDNDLILYEDFENLSPNDLTKVILEYNLNPDNVGVLIDEVKILDHPYILSKTKKMVHPSKIYIKPVSTTRSTKMIKEGIDYFINTKDWSMFDNYIHEEHENIDATLPKIGAQVSVNAKAGAKQAWEDTKQDIANDVGLWGKKAVKYAGALYIANKTLNHLAKKYAESDAKKPRHLRSKLIADLRILKGKSAEYESKLERTRREDYEKRSILGKILFKIREAILYILNKLGLYDSLDL